MKYFLKLKTYLFIIAFTILLLPVVGQNINEQNQLAQEYYANKEYEKAASIFLELYNNQKSKVYYSYYINCLVLNNDFETAEKVIKKEIKRNDLDLTYYVDLGYVYKTQNKLKEADEEFQKAIKLIIPNNSQIITLANQFVQRREFDYAEQTYLKGRKLLKEIYGFHFELAYLYLVQRMYDNMITEYLDLLEIHESYLQTVQNQLQATVYSDKENDLTGKLKGQLIKRIQKEPDRIIFSELLIWLYLQEKDYNNAYIHSIALDKRRKEDGTRIMELARQAAGNKDYSIAMKAYQYVIDKGKYNPWFIEAKSENMNTLYSRVIDSPGVLNEEILNLETLLKNTLEELGWSKSTFTLIKALSNVQTFYLNNPEEAEKNLEYALNTAALKPIQVSECKLLLGDICLYNNDIWGATLYYAQVEKANENEPIGHEAKFRKARLAYYAGDFLWAQAQLDVLKASTSKLIANDAFTLSLLISNNLIDDTTGTALMMYSRAELFSFRHKDSLAILTLDSILKKFNVHSILDETYFKLGELYFKKTDYTQAVAFFDTVVTKFNYDLLADNALFFLGSIYEYYMPDKEKAMGYYEKILTDYPGSTLVVDARKHFRYLRGDNLSKEELFFMNIAP